MSLYRGRGLTRSRRARPVVRRSGARRVITWDANLFQPTDVAAGVITEFNLMSEADLATRSLGRGTVGMIYGRLAAAIPEGEAQFDNASFAWGIRLKEADAPASAAAAFSPLTDADSSDWITWRAGSMTKSSGTGTGANSDPTGWVDEPFIIKNPRKIDNDEELVMLFEALSTNTAAVRVSFWCRVMLILP